MTRWFTSFVLILAVVLPVAGWAWKGSLGTPTPIAEVHERAESGDYVIVEGVIVALSDYLRREIETTPGRSPLHERVRVAGKWDNAYMDKDTWGIRATAIERVED